MSDLGILVGENTTIKFNGKDYLIITPDQFYLELKQSTLTIIYAGPYLPVISKEQLEDLANDLNISPEIKSGEKGTSMWIAKLPKGTKINLL